MGGTFPTWLIKTLLQAGISPDTRYLNGTPWLVEAIRNSDTEQIDLLLRTGASLQRNDKVGGSAAYYAIASSDESVFERVCIKQDCAGFLSTESIIPATTTILQNHMFDARKAVLYAAGLRVRLQRDGGPKLLPVALAANDSEAVRELLEQGASASQVKFDDVARVLDENRDDLFALILSADFDTSLKSADGKDLVFALVENENIIGLANLLERGFPLPHSYGKYNPLTLALLKGNTGIALRLLDSGVNPDQGYGGLSPIDAAELSMDDVFLRKLASVVPNFDGPTGREPSEDLQRISRQLSYLGYASASGNQAVGASAALKRFQGQHPELYPHGHLSVATMRLVEMQPEVQFFGWITASDSPTVVSTLLKTHPALIKARDAYGWDGLMHASFRHRKEIVRVLLANGASVKNMDKAGSTALLLAGLSSAPSATSKVNVVAQLLAAGADTASKNRDGLSPSLLARSRDSWYTRALGEKPFDPNAEQFIAVMGREASIPTQYYKCGSWPKDWIEKRWDEGQYIQDIAYLGNQWCVVMGNAPIIRGSQRYVNSSSIKAANDKAIRDGETLYDIVRADSSNSRMLFTQSRKGYWDGSVYVSTRDVEDTIRKLVWGKGQNISRLIPAGKDEYLIIYGSTRGYGRQSWWSGPREQALEHTKKMWREGKHITSLEQSGRQWDVVWSGGTDLKGQTLVISSSWDDFKRRLKKKWDAGWTIQFFVDGNLAQGTGGSS